MNVLVLGKPQCHYCKLACDLLEYNQIPFDYVDVTQQPEQIEFIKTVLKRSTVPQIKYEGKWIGGYQELVEKLGGETAQ